MEGREIELKGSTTCIPILVDWSLGEQGTELQCGFHFDVRSTDDNGCRAGKHSRGFVIRVVSKFGDDEVCLACIRDAQKL